MRKRASERSQLKQLYLNYAKKLPWDTPKKSYQTLKSLSDGAKSKYFPDDAISDFCFEYNAWHLLVDLLATHARDVEEFMKGIPNLVEKPSGSPRGLKNAVRKYLIGTVQQPLYRGKPIRYVLGLLKTAEEDADEVQKDLGYAEDFQEAIEILHDLEPYWYKYVSRTVTRVDDMQITVQSIGRALKLTREEIQDEWNFIQKTPTWR